MEQQNLIFRMYGLVLYSLSGIQKGIQFGHAVVEYGLEMYDEQTFLQSSYKQWSTIDKTFIILSGGSTNDNPKKLGTLNKHYLTLIENEIRCVYFTEPDLGDQITAVVFLVDNRVWDKETYPDFEETESCTLMQWKKKFSKDEKERNKIIFLREFLKQFKLA